MKEIFEGIEFEILQEYQNDFSKNEIQYDSRQIKEGDIFVALTGSSVDGHDYIQRAVENQRDEKFCNEKRCGDAQSQSHARHRQFAAASGKGARRQGEKFRTVPFGAHADAPHCSAAEITKTKAFPQSRKKAFFIGYYSLSSFLHVSATNLKLSSSKGESKPHSSISCVKGFVPPKLRNFIYLSKADL